MGGIAQPVADDGYPVTLGGKDYRVGEPAFGKLRQALKRYRALAEIEGDDEEANLQRQRAAASLLAVFFSDAALRRRVSLEELIAFVGAVPAICKLEKADPGAAADEDFGSVYAHLSATYGWTYDYIDSKMTLSRLREMSDYLKRNPPTHQLVAAYLGYEYQAPQQRVRQFFMKALGRA